MRSSRYLSAPFARRRSSVVVACAVALGALPAQAQSPRTELGLARDYFLIADFSSALEKASDLIASGTLELPERREAFVLKARCQVGLRNPAGAVDAFCSALQLEPAWKPALAELTRRERDSFEEAYELCGPLDPVDLDLEIASAPDTLPEDESPPEKAAAGWPPPVVAERPWYRSALFLGAAGGVVVGLALISLGGEDDSQDVPLPAFPPPPE